MQHVIMMAYHHHPSIELHSLLRRAVLSMFIQMMEISVR